MTKKTSKKSVALSSAGAVSKTAFSGNSFKVLNLVGSPWDAGQDGRYAIEAYHIRLDNYFSDTVFEAFDYFKVVSCETTFEWRMPPKDGPIMGQMFYYIDRDDATIPTVANIGNRRELKHMMFTNEHHTRKVTWRPNLVTEEHLTMDPVNYVHPRGQWLNSGEVRSLRFGTMVVMYTTPAGAVQYPTYDATVSIRHKLTLEFKGQRSVQIVQSTS